MAVDFLVLSLCEKEFLLLCSKVYHQFIIYFCTKKTSSKKRHNFWFGFSSLMKTLEQVPCKVLNVEWDTKGKREGRQTTRDVALNYVSGGDRGERWLWRCLCLKTADKTGKKEYRIMLKVKKTKEKSVKCVRKSSIFFMTKFSFIFLFRLSFFSFWHHQWTELTFTTHLFFSFILLQISLKAHFIIVNRQKHSLFAIKWLLITFRVSFPFCGNRKWGSGASFSSCA